MIRNRRQHRRVNAFISVAAEINGETHYLSTTNVSAGGAYIGSSEMAPAGSALQLEFRGARGPENTVYIAAEVARCEHPDLSDVPGFAVFWLRAWCSHGGERLRGFLKNVLNIRDLSMRTDPDGTAHYAFAEREAIDADSFERVPRETVPVATEELRRAAERAKADVEAARAQLGDDVDTGPRARPRTHTVSDPPLMSLSPAAPPLPRRETIPATAMPDLNPGRSDRETLKDGAVQGLGAEPPVGAMRSSEDAFSSDPPSERFDPGADIASNAADQLLRAQLRAATVTPKMRRPTSIGNNVREAKSMTPAIATKSADFAGSADVDSEEVGKQRSPPPPPAAGSMRKLWKKTASLLGIRSADDKPRLGRFAVTDDGKFYRPDDLEGPDS